MIWVLSAIHLGGFTTTNLCDADMIRRQNPVRLVSPDWVSPRGNLLAWLDAETRARTRLVFVAWALAMFWILRRHFRRHDMKRSSWILLTPSVKTGSKRRALRVRDQFVRTGRFITTSGPFI